MAGTGQTVIDLDRKRMQAMAAKDIATLESLLADDLGCRVFDNARAMDARLFLRSNKILKRLADPPYTGVPLPGRPE